MVEEEKPADPTVTRTWPCTADNVADVRAFVAGWPELGALIAGLRDQGVFPGLRGLHISATGPASLLDGGLPALNAQNAATALPAARTE